MKLTPYSVVMLFLVLLIGAVPAQADYLVTLRNSYFDLGVNRIVRLDDNLNLIGDVVSNGQALAGDLRGPTGIQLDSNGDLLVASYFSNKVLRYDPVSGAYQGDFAPTALDPPIPAFDGPSALRVSNGEVYVTNLGSPLAGSMGASVPVLAGTTGDFNANFGTGHSGPAGLLFNGSNVYVSQFTSGQVLRFDLSGNLQQTISDALIVGPTGLEIDPNTGDLLIASVTGDRIVSFDGTTASEFLTLPANFFPSGIQFLNTSEFLVWSTSAATILKYQVGNQVPVGAIDYTAFGYTQQDLLELNGVAIGDVLQVAAVPEPGACLLVILGAMPLMMRYTRRLRRKSG